MAKNILIIVVALLALGGGAYAIVSNSDRNDEVPENMQDTSTSMNDMEMTSSPQSTTSPSQSDTSNAVVASEVSIQDYAYAPATITVKKGTKVTWTNKDSARLDVTPDNESSDFKASELLAKGESYSVTFNSTGTYSYYCSPHTYMKGTVVVTE